MGGTGARTGADLHRGAVTRLGPSDQPMSIAPQPEDILRFLADHGEDTVLVTLVGIVGSASRAIGTQMGVARDGSYCGSLSGGCIESAVVAEALDVLSTRRGRVVRFGAGSPYIDVKLPCGGGFDLMFTPCPSADVLDGAITALGQREPFSIAISVDGIRAKDESNIGGIGSNHFNFQYFPRIRVIAVGQGSELSALIRLASEFGAEISAITPAEQLFRLHTSADLPIHPAPSRVALPPISGDPWTAIVFLFHDRDWEEHLLPQALELDGFYHGAIGSPHTQAVRRETLEACGTSAANIAKLRSAVGLIPSTRDPGTLALSILAELAAEYQALVLGQRSL
jgi:xanthine dehydrogenase accessory factor